MLPSRPDAQGRPTMVDGVRTAGRACGRPTRTLGRMTPTDPTVTTTPGPPGAPADDVADLAARLLLLADQDFAGYSPVYDRIARALAEDPASLGVLLGIAPVNRTPVLALAATRHIVLAEPSSLLARIHAGTSDADPWPPFRDLLHERQEEVRATMAARSIQTNEVGRAAALLPGAAAALGAGPSPWALVEVGPSAGLNLLLDRFSVTYTDATGAVVHAAGPAGSPVQLRCELRGPGRPAAYEPSGPIAWRAGLDLAPVDVTDPDERRWLTACLWPGIPERPERLAAALELAAADPPPLRSGDAATDLEALLDEVPADLAIVVSSTWALAYLSGEGRRAVAATIDRVGVRREITLLSAEAANVTPWVPPTRADRGEFDGADGTPTVLGVRRWTAGERTDRALAVMHPHGRWMAWEGEP
jgi:hypothetical protein